MPVSFLTPEDLQPINDTIVDLVTSNTALSATLQALESRIAALEVAPPLPPPPPPPAPTELNLNLLGGYRLHAEFARGQLAIDHANSKAYVAGHAQRNEVYEYDLPAMGTGSDISTWPALQPVRVIQPWWPESEGYCNGLMVRDGKLWACPRVFYDMQPPAVTKYYSNAGDVVTVNVPRQEYAGFVKSATGFELGCGGYESGQGAACGPTLAGLDGTAKIAHPWSLTWEGREKREPNYYPVNHIDSWLALEPRNGEGRWACDRIYGGGIRLASGVYYWCWMGTGDINYDRQNETFAADGLNKTYQYRYDPVTHQLLGWKEIPGLLKVAGQDISPDGQRIYLSEVFGWSGGMYKVDPVLRIYGVA